MSNDKIMALLRKIKALAEAGVEGERETAQERLDFLMKKYDISLDALEGETKTKFKFRLRKDQFNFFNQICFNVCNDDYGMWFAKRYPTGESDVYQIECTDAQYIEIQAKFEFYWKRYQADLEIFYRAFIQRNKLYGTPTKEDEKREMTEKDWQILQMSQGLKAHPFHKQIEK
jgi:hypothetical protein